MKKNEAYIVAGGFRRTVKFLPFSADGLLILPGDKLYTIMTFDSGKTWHVSKARRVGSIARRMVMFADSWGLWESLMAGDNRIYHRKSFAVAEAKRRTKLASGKAVPNG